MGVVADDNWAHNAHTLSLFGLVVFVAVISARQRTADARALRYCHNRSNVLFDSAEHSPSSQSYHLAFSCW